jgi:hypothetical protein
MDDPSTAESPETAEAPKSDDSKEPRRPFLDANGMERPVFLLDFPEDPALEALIQAFEAGNYARVREGADLLARSHESAAVRDAALELRRRIEPDPLAKYLIAISVVLLVVLTVWAYHVESH